MMCRHLRALLLPLLAAVALVGCGGDDDGGSPETQPAPDVSTFQEGDFADIPLPPLAEPAGERSERDGVVVQSYFVRGRTPEQVLAFYDEFFGEEGAQEIISPEPFGNEAWRGSWLVGERELLVSATTAPLAEDGNIEHADVMTQMSLELAPAGGGGHENDPAESPVEE